MTEQIKKLNELTKYLNDEMIRSSRDLFTVEQNDNNAYIKFDEFNVITFRKDDWHIENDFGMLNSEIQKIIINYANRTSAKDWFIPQKRYNIIVGPSYKEDNVTAYYKTEREEWLNVFADIMCLDAFASATDLTREEYKFTEQEIKELKSTLPENMAEIVELGKVEIKNED